MEGRFTSLFFHITTLRDILWHATKCEALVDMAVNVSPSAQCAFVDTLLNAGTQARDPLAMCIVAVSFCSFVSQSRHCNKVCVCNVSASQGSGLASHTVSTQDGCHMLLTTSMCSHLAKKNSDSL